MINRFWVVYASFNIDQGKIPSAQKIQCTKKENPLIQALEHKFLVIFSNEGFLWNLNVAVLVIHMCMLGYNVM